MASDAVPDWFRSFGAWLVSLGFEVATSPGAKKWVGIVGGREVAVIIRRVSRTRYAGEVRYRQALGFRLAVEAATSVPTELFLVPQSFADHRLIRWWYRVRGRQVLGAVPAGFDGFRAVSGVEPAWAERFLADPDVPGLAAGLLSEKTEAGVKGSVYLVPGFAVYGSGNLQAQDLDPEWAATVLHRIVALAGIVERLPRPLQPRNPSRFAILARKNPVLGGCLFMGAVLGVFATIGLALAALLFLLARVLSGD